MLKQISMTIIKDRINLPSLADQTCFFNKKIMKFMPSTKSLPLYQCLCQTHITNTYDFFCVCVCFMLPTIFLLSLKTLF